MEIEDPIDLLHGQPNYFHDPRTYQGPLLIHGVVAFTSIEG